MEDDEDDAGEDDGTGEWSLGFLEHHRSVYGGFDALRSFDNQEHLCQGHGGDVRTNTTAPNQTTTASLLSAGASTARRAISAVTTGSWTTATARARAASNRVQRGRSVRLTVQAVSLFFFLLKAALLTAWSGYFPRG